MSYRNSMRAIAAGSVLAAARAGADSHTASIVRDAGKSAMYFDNSYYAYTVFPTIGQGRLGIRLTHGNDRVHVVSMREGKIGMSPVSARLQAGAESRGAIIYFKEKRAFDECESGLFQWSADVSVVAITAAGGASMGTVAAHAGASAGSTDFPAADRHQKGLMVFTVGKGGAMLNSSVVDRKFS